MNSLLALDIFSFLNFFCFFVFFPSSPSKFQDAAADLITVCNTPSLPSFPSFLSLSLASFLCFSESFVVAAPLVAGGGSVEDGRWLANDPGWRRVAAGTD